MTKYAIILLNMVEGTFLRRSIFGHRACEKGWPLFGPSHLTCRTDLLEIRTRNWAQLGGLPISIPLIGGRLRGGCPFILYKSQGWQTPTGAAERFNNPPKGKIGIVPPHLPKLVVSFWLPCNQPPTVGSNTSPVSTWQPRLPT